MSVRDRQTVESTVDFEIDSVVAAFEVVSVLTDLASILSAT